MNIEQTQGDALSTTLKLTIESEDYTGRVKKSLQDFRRNSEIRGFRKGMVPMGLIQKMHGRTALLEEVNKLMSEGVNQYISDNKIKIIGEPLPNDDLQKSIDWERDEAFTFVFDLMLAPTVALSLTADDHISIKESEISQSDRDEYVSALCKQREYPSDTDFNQDFFDKILGPDQANSLDSFWDRISERMRREFEAERNYRFMLDVRAYVIAKSAILLPDTLLKRWLHYTNEGKFSMEEIERDYEAFAKDFRWQLIREYLVQQNNIQVTKADLMTQALKVAQYHFSMYGLHSVPAEHLEKYAQSLLDKDKESHRIAEKVEDDKVIDFIRSQVTLDPDTIPFSQIFIK